MLAGIDRRRNFWPEPNMAVAGADSFWPEPEPELGYFSCKIFELIMNRNFAKNLNIMFIYSGP